MPGHRRAALLLLLASALCGCIEGPRAPKDSETGAYGWRAALAVAGNEAVYRFDIPPDLQQWLSDRRMQSVAVFDAQGKPQACGRFGSSNGPLESIATTSEGRVAEFDAAACTPHGSPAVCFRGRACDVPDYCPRVPIDLTRSTSLSRIDALADLVAIANAPPGDCDRSDAGAHCSGTGAFDEGAVRTRREARGALISARLGDLLTPDPPPPPRTTPGQFNPSSVLIGGGLHGMAGGAILSGRGSSSASRATGPMPLRPIGVPDPRTTTGSGERDASADAGGYVVRFDEPATEIRLYWQTATRGSAIGTTRIIAYDNEGRRHEHTDPLQPFGESPPDRLAQVVWTDLKPHAFRVIANSTAADARLVAATSTKHEHKPFVDTHLQQFWFVASGAAPYALYLERGRGLCGATENPREMSAYPRLRDADWPPAASVGAPVTNPRGTLPELAVSRYDVVVWLYWAAGMFVLWLAAAAIVGVRWRMLSRTAPQRRG